jgi:hypothetical protein
VVPVPPKQVNDRQIEELRSLKKYSESAETDILKRLQDKYNKIDGIKSHREITSDILKAEGVLEPTQMAADGTFAKKQST